MDVTELLVAARRAVDGADLPPDLRAIAFEKAVDLLIGKPLSAPIAEAAGNTNAAGSRANETGTSSDILGQIGLRLGLDAGVVREVFHEENGSLRIVVQRSRLAKSNWAGSKELAILVVAGQIAAGLEEQVSQDEIRSVVEYYGKYDSNFSKALNELDDEFYFDGTPRKRFYRLRKAGWEHAAQLIERVGGEA